MGGFHAASSPMHHFSLLHHFSCQRCKVAKRVQLHRERKKAETAAQQAAAKGAAGVVAWRGCATALSHANTVPHH